MHRGIPASSGIAIGKALIFEKETPVIEKRFIQSDNIQNEKDRLQKAIEISKKQIEAIKQNVDIKMAEIMDAHLLMLEDVELIGMIFSKVEENQDIVSSTNDSVEFYAKMLEGLDDSYMRERADDLRDIGYRLVMNLLEKEIVSLLSLSESRIIISHDIAPSDTAQMDRQKVSGFLTDIGGKTSHAAIMAKTLEIPAILGLGDITSKIKNNDIICFDGEEGIVHINPDKKTLEEFERRLAEYEELKTSLLPFRDKESRTSDGHQVETGCNIGSPKDTESAIKNGAEGIGLYRTEFLYMDRENLPSENEQFDAYRSVLEQMKNKPVIIRTLDIGGDKKLPYLSLPEELNPFLGYRAIRICLDQKELFKVQLRALLRASIYGNLKIMYPMISCVEEVREANIILEECKAELDKEGEKYGDFEIGVMIEIPSAAISADIIAKEVDFFSIGTNDLIQYTCAVDRMNQKIANLYNPFNPSVLRLIKNVIDSAHKNNIRCGMCGETAGNKYLIPIYLGMGLDEFSMSARSILSARKQISEISLEKATEIANKVLDMSTASEIEEYMKTQVK